MNVVKPGILAALTLSSQLSLAELKAVDDADLSGVTGQGGGLTIDIDMGIEIGEFMYQDAGSIVMQGLRLGGMDRTAGGVGTLYEAGAGLVDDPLDPTGFMSGPGTNAGGTTGLNNVRIYVDIAGDGTGLNGSIPHPLGPTYPAIPIPDNFFRWAWGQFTNAGSGGALGCGDNGNCGFLANDGDLFIHASPIDAGATDNGTALTIADFGLELDKFALKDSTYQAGDDISNPGNTAQSTTIMSNLRMEGYLGGFDMLLENKGNGFGVYDALGNFTETGAGDAASKIKLNTFVKVTEMEYDFDIIGVRYEKIAIHNNRGNFDIFDFLTQSDYSPGPNVSTTQGFAQSNTQLSAVKDAVLNLNTLSSQTGNNIPGYVDGIKFKSRFQGDMDIGHLSFGDTGDSIGKQYYTDMDVYTNLVFSAQ